MNLKGDFEGLSLSGIFQLLCNDQKTGFLRVSNSENESRVCFNNGTIVYASSSLRKAHLGFMMMSDGVISREQLEECLVSAKENRQSLGKVLVERGYVSSAILGKYTTKQVEEIVYNLLLWKKGKFEYRDATLDLSGMIITRLNPMKLMLEASRRMDEMSVLTEAIPSDRIIFQISPKAESQEELKFNAGELKILSLVDGNRTVAQIVQEGGYNEFSVYKILFSLLSYGLIERNEEIELNAVKRKNHLPPDSPLDDDTPQILTRDISTGSDDKRYSLFKEHKFVRVISYDTREVRIDSPMLLFLYEVDGERSAGEIAGKLKFTQSMLISVAERLLELELISATRSDHYLSDDFFKHLLEQFSMAVGPLADIVIEDAIGEMGFERGAFPTQSAADLVNKLSLEIKREEKREIFQQQMARLTLQ